jgi:hypothetical protein
MSSTYKIVVRCPVTGNWVDSGILTSSNDAVNSGLYQDSVIYCAHCRKLHAFADHSYLSVDPQASLTGSWRPNRY